MAYTKQTWIAGDVITAERLNHLENGVSGAGGALAVEAVLDEASGSTTLSETWQTIYDAIEAGRLVYIYKTNEFDSNLEAHVSLVLSAVHYSGGNYSVSGLYQSNFETNTADGYPSSAETSS